MLKKARLGLSLTAGLIFAGLTAAPASAAIRCDGPYQINKIGGPILTPYCEDNYLAYIGRRFYGLRYSAHSIRWNPSVKQRACEVAGHDQRVREICLGFGLEDNGFRSR